MRWVLLAAAVFPACAVYQPAQLNSKEGSIDDGGGGADSAAGMSSGGADATGGTNGTAGSSAGAPSVGMSGMSAGGSSAGSGGSGVVVGGSAGQGVGGSLAGAASGGTSGSGTAGASAGSGGTAAGAGGAAAGAGGSGGAVATVNPCLRKNWTATASAYSDSTTNTGLHNPPAFGVDGDTNTRWSLGAFQLGGEWYRVDLGARATHLTQVVLDTTKDPGDIPAAYKLELSDDGTVWTQVATGAGATVTTINFADHGGRYIRATQTGTSSTAWWTIHEFTITCTP